MTTKIITLANRKGGAGKTTAATTIASGLAFRGKNVLLIDLDGQASVSRWLGLVRDDGAFALLTLDVSKKPVAEMVRSMVISSRRDHLYVLPGSEKTYSAVNILSGKPISHLRKVIASLFFRGSIDYIVIDTQPGESFELQTMAIWAADYLIIPTACAQSSLDGLYSLWETAKRMKAEIDPDRVWHGAVLGVLINEYEQGKTTSEETLARVIEKCSQEAILGPIHRAQLFKQMEGQGLTLWEKDPKSRAAQEYNAILSKIIRLS
jgi:chromosome partitioning protein